jgi:hypothetical protein
MTGASILANPALLRAVVIGAFGGTGLALTAIYSRRGPLIYPVYATILAALALLLARYPALTYVARLTAALTGFGVASAALYFTTGVLADRQRRRLVAQGRLPPAALHYHLSVLGHAWRIGMLVAIGTLVSAGVAFVSV